jgi:hypothetical protein
MTSLYVAAARPVLIRSRTRANLWWLSVIGLCAVLLAPLLIVDVPPLLDYPNHLARAFLLASLPQDPVLAQFYAARWSIIPNLALDLVAPPLMQVLPVHVVGRLLIAAAVLLPALGAIAYNAALGAIPDNARPGGIGCSAAPGGLIGNAAPGGIIGYAAVDGIIGYAAAGGIIGSAAAGGIIGSAAAGGIIGNAAAGGIIGNAAAGGRWWPLCVGFVAYNGCLLSGFLNFQIALGLALLLAASWLQWRETRTTRAVVLAAVGAPLLFVCHLMGLVFVGLLIGGTELYRLSLERTAIAALRRLAVLVAIFASPVVLYAISSLQPLGGDAEFLSPGAKLLQLTAPFVNYSWTLDMTAAAVAVAVPAMGLALGWGRVPGAAAIPMVLLLVVFLAAPFAWKGTYALDTRFAIMLGFMVFAGFVAGRWPSWFQSAATLTLLTLFAVRMGVLMTAWAAHRGDLADLRAALAPVRPGQAVYVAEATLQEAPAYWATNPGSRLLSNGARMDEHLGALALIEQRAFWPFEFDTMSQQPIETQEPYRTMAARVGHLPSRMEVAVADVCGFDYVLLIQADSVRALPAERFRLLVQSGFAALYSITSCERPR